MNDPLFLNLEEVLRIHQFQVDSFGGDAGILNLGLLDSALAQPKMTWKFTQADLATLAATYSFSHCTEPSLADRNKRTAAHVAIVFLGMNGIDVDYPVDEAERITVGVASRAIGKPEAIEFFQRLVAEG